METGFRSWWQKRRKLLLVIGIIALLVVMIVLIWASYANKWSGAGFANKTVWDWLNLLAVLAIPVAVALGTAWFTKKQVQASEAGNKNNQRKATLQANIDNISNLQLAQNLRNPG